MALPTLPPDDEQIAEAVAALRVALAPFVDGGEERELAAVFALIISAAEAAREYFGVEGRRSMFEAVFSEDEEEGTI